MNEEEAGDEDKNVYHKVIRGAVNIIAAKAVEDRSKQLLRERITKF